MKVYLSRSNAADPAVFSLVQQVIENLGHEIVTFNGGKYSKEPLLACDALVIVPSAEMLPGMERGEYNTFLQDNEPDIGKGQYEQCIDFAKRHTEDYVDCGEDIEYIEMKSGKLMLVVQEVENSHGEEASVYVNSITEIREQDTTDWKTRYGFLSHDDSYINIASVLGREMQTKLFTCKEELLYPVSNSPMLGAASMLGLL